MSSPNVFTRWTCDVCENTVTIAGALDGDPDEPAWSRVRVDTAFRTTGRYGSALSRPAETEKYRSKLVCSRSCAHTALDEIVDYTFGRDR